MQTLFTKKHGKKQFAPHYFIVVYQKGQEPKKYPHGEGSIDEGIFYDYQNAHKVELYKNGTHNLAPTMTDCVVQEVK